MKMTDESVAKALGYYVDIHVTTGNKLVRPPHKKYPSLPSTAHPVKLPAFTTSLDAIVAEIEARGFSYEFWRGDSGQRGATVGGKNRFCHEAKTAPLALCAALLAYLKETVPDGANEKENGR